MSIPYCEICDRLMIEEQRPIYSTRSSYSSYWELIFQNVVLLDMKNIIDVRM